MWSRQRGVTFSVEISNRVIVVCGYDLYCSHELCLQVVNEIELPIQTLVRLEEKVSSLDGRCVRLTGYVWIKSELVCFGERQEWVYTWKKSRKDGWHPFSRIWGILDGHM
jgi:hypothetical protein